MQTTILSNSYVRSISLCRQVFRSYFYIPLREVDILQRLSCVLSSEPWMPHPIFQVSLCLRTKDTPALIVYAYLRTCGTPRVPRTKSNFPSSPVLTNRGYLSVTKSSLLTTKDIARYPCLRITVLPS